MQSNTPASLALANRPASAPCLRDVAEHGRFPDGEKNRIEFSFADTPTPLRHAKTPPMSLTAIKSYAFDTPPGSPTKLDLCSKILIDTRKATTRCPFTRINNNRQGPSLSRAVRARTGQPHRETPFRGDVCKLRGISITVYPETLSEPLILPVFRTQVAHQTCD